jgi:N-acetyl-gamma-glutamyl-phosphate reductase
VKVVDMSGDFRLRDAAAYERYYGAKHPHPEMLGSFVYGLPELNRDAIRAARAVASPGCFATTIELGLLPLARAGKLAGANVHVVGMTGSSGSGIAPTAGHAPSRARREPEAVQGARAPAHARDPGDAGGRRRARRRAGIRAGVGAAVARDSSPPASSSCRPT